METKLIDYVSENVANMITEIHMFCSRQKMHQNWQPTCSTDSLLLMGLCTLMR